MKITVVQTDHDLYGIYANDTLIHSYSPGDDITFLMQSVCTATGAEFERKNSDLDDGELPETLK